MTQEKTQSIRKTNTYAMAVTALMTAVTCILAPMSIPIGPVPISLTNFAIYLSLYLLDWKKGTLSYFVYLLIGFAGLPVFSGFTGGIPFCACVSYEMTGPPPESDRAASIASR